MGEYTEFLEDKTCNIHDEEDYLEELEKTTKIFRFFDKALDTFIEERGFTGDIDNDDEKIKYIFDRFKSAGVPIPRNIKKWYSEHKIIERKTAFQICFAFGLGVEEIDDFLRRICLFRGFDCHCRDEVIYFYAFKNRMSYEKTQEIIDKVERMKQGKIDTEEIVYTDFIVDEIDEIESVEELVEYLFENSSVFEYNNATAYKFTKSLWQSISDEQGLAVKEKKKLYDPFDNEWDQAEEENENSKKRKERKRVDDSIWEIYLQILGLSGSYSSKFYKERSIKWILKDSDLLHPLAEDSFPDRDGLNKILNGEHISYERVRKILILLVFYRFWVNKALVKNNYDAEYGDADRCRASIDDYLTHAGYPCVYAGNPYDFIILYANNSETPLFTFREYMRELFFMKGDNVASKYTFYDGIMHSQIQ